MKKIVLIALTLFISQSLFAQEGRILSSMQANSSARSAAMGNVMLGNADEMYLYTNPSALVFSNKEFAVDFSTELYPDTADGRQKQYNLSGAYKLGYHHAILLGARYQNGLDVSGIKPYEWTTDIGYAFEVIPELVVYATGSYFETSVGSKAKGMAFSLGLGYQKKLQEQGLLTFGLRCQDFGKAVKFNETGLPRPLPMSLSLGGDYSFKFNKHHQLTYGLSARYFSPKGGEMLQLNTGTEYRLMNMFSARLGYQYAQHEGSRLTMGLGCEYEGFKLNASYQKTFIVEGVDLFMFGLGFSL